MSRLRNVVSAFVFALIIAPPLGAQSPQFRANVAQTGDTPFTGMMYYGASRMRIEGVSDGEQMTMIIGGARAR
jgi:hypothetical protein